MSQAPSQSVLAIVGTATALLMVTAAIVAGMTSTTVWPGQFILEICLPPTVLSALGVSIQGGFGRWLVRSAGIYLLAWAVMALFSAGFALGLIAAMFFVASNKEIWLPPAVDAPETVDDPIGPSERKPPARANRAKW